MFAPGVACITTTFVEMLDRLVEQADEIVELHLQLYATTAALEELSSQMGSEEYSLSMAS